jgi:hypothetical protein
MKTFRFLLLFLIATPLGATAVVAQKPTAPGVSNQHQTLYDFRVARKNAFPKIPPAVQRTVLSSVFRKYLTDENKCNSQWQPRSGIDPLLAARNAGQIAPSILDQANGSFTAPGQTETAYVISVSECNASHAENFGTKRIAIFSQGKLVVDVDADFSSGIVRKTDLDGDGVDELLLTSGDMNQGTIVEMAALVGFRRGRRQVIADFGTVSEDACPSEAPGSVATAAVVSMSPGAAGKFPKFRIDNYQASCRNPRRWRFRSTGRVG